MAVHQQIYRWFPVAGYSADNGEASGIAAMSYQTNSIATYLATLLAVLPTASFAQYYPNQQYANSQQTAPRYGAGFGGSGNAFSSGFNSIARTNGSYGGGNAANGYGGYSNGYAQNNNAGGSYSTMQQLEHQLNRVDNQQAWDRTPVTAPVQHSRRAPASMFGRQQMMQTFLEGASSPSYARADANRARYNADTIR
jgi:hypothetical protein